MTPTCTLAGGEGAAVGRGAFAAGPGGAGAEAPRGTSPDARVQLLPSTSAARRRPAIPCSPERCRSIALIVALLASLPQVHYSQVEAPRRKPGSGHRGQAALAARLNRGATSA